jgi:hypothetical protein
MSKATTFEFEVEGTMKADKQMQQLAFVTNSTLSKFEVYQRSRNRGLDFDMHFQFLIHLDFERVWCREVELYSISDYKNAASSPRIHDTEQVAP